MKKIVTETIEVTHSYCDICNKNGHYVCSICGRDICWTHARSYHSIIGDYEPTGETGVICTECDTNLVKLDSLKWEVNHEAENLKLQYTEQQRIIKQKLYNKVKQLTLGEDSCKSFPKSPILHAKAGQ